MTARVLMLCQATSPISHAARTAGNEAVVARQSILTDRGVVAVPFISGNALRHVAVRAPGARWLMDRLGLQGKLSLPQLNFLLHGGNLTDGGGFEDTRLIADSLRVLPLVGLLGGAAPTQILSGSLLAGQGVLVCRETVGLMPPEILSLLPPGNLRPAETFISGYQYTRGDAAKTAPDMLGQPEATDSNLMIFAGQAVMPGAWFAVDMTIFRRTEPAEFGALLWSLRLWAAAGAKIGGQSARGHGRLFPIVVAGPSEAEQDELVAEYHRAVDERAEDARRWLADVFAPRSAKEKKGKAS